MAEFHWCLNPKCESGQLHYGGAKFQCHECKSEACIKHGVTWHIGETCDEYDKSREGTQERDLDFASEQWKITLTR